MQKHPVKEAIEAADRAISAEDFDALMAFYAEDATLVVKPGLQARGKEQIRKAFIAIAEYFNHQISVKQGRMEIIEGAGTALVIMETRLETGGAVIERRATYVFRAEADGRWLCVVDNSYGTELLTAVG
ncbi:YybH family protein [Pseudoduganella violaceinigra]|uniref:YybH family protein n=1 Tax=Pseudoduganella violaceinigra TaxID=246602 RepID=UPI00040ABEA9|nr:nuclear transport factor 2 family protein [Pseudoduganella violaceinigra]